MKRACCILLPTATDAIMQLLLLVWSLFSKSLSSMAFENGRQVSEEKWTRVVTEIASDYIDSSTRYVEPSLVYTKKQPGRDCTNETCVKSLLMLPSHPWICST